MATLTEVKDLGQQEYAVKQVLEHLRAIRAGFGPDTDHLRAEVEALIAKFEAIRFDLNRRWVRAMVSLPKSQ